MSQGCCSSDHKINHVLTHKLDIKPALVYNLKGFFCSTIRLGEKCYFIPLQEGVFTKFHSPKTADPFPPQILTTSPSNEYPELQEWVAVVPKSNGAVVSEVYTMAPCVRSVRA